MLTGGQLFNYGKQYAKEFWDLELNIPIYINGRLTRLLGRFVYNRYDRTETRIELSKDLVDNFKDEDVLDVLKHELTHWALYKLGKPHNDGHTVFENELVRVGAKFVQYAIT
jgi:SprT-like protein